VTHEWEPGFDAAAEALPGSPVFAFAGGRVVLAAEEPFELPTLASLPLEREQLLPVGRLAGETAFAAIVDADKEATTASLRSVLASAPAPIAAAAGRAAQLVEWELGHAFCGRCGASTRPHERELARVCPSCAAHFYPRIAPAVIVLVERDGCVLLARRAGLERPFFSVLAGFVEPGETLEETVRREVLEEVGIEVDGVRYFGSQPWPFPSQLMIGFTARHAAGEIRVDEVELAEAHWYAPGELPPIPGPFTIARWLIDDFVSRTRSAV
jgi:NAD+ diphosphatase